jgi:acyl carrier protein
MSTLESLQGILVKDYGLARERLAPDATFDTLGMDSLSLLELMFKIEDTFEVRIPGEAPADLKTLQDAVVYVDGLIALRTSSSANRTA